MSLTRRQVLLRSAAAFALPLYSTLESQPLAAQAPAPPIGPFTLPALPYAADALEPHIDAQTMTIHYDRHHATYVTNLNTALASYNDLKTRPVDDLVKNLDTLPEAVRTAVRNQGGGHLNHSWFWTSLKKGGSAPPSAEFGKAIETKFGDFAKFKESLAVAATGVFGIGWGWLSVDRTGQLVIETTPNQDNPLTRGNRPLLGIDVWEHAYYLKYQNRRRDYVDAIFNVIDWDVVQERWRAARG
ncbi:MAG: superoxide dismutase [Vicinamibacterales bacterium]